MAKRFVDCKVVGLVAELAMLEKSTESEEELTMRYGD
jgi:hypothetical protein